ncbi:MAG: hypothetical protein GX757_10625 [Clostridiales bacterium]|nr:hypothetical protein [Clostridiales bacterium]
MKKLGNWLIIIGVFFLSIDIAIQMGNAYPEMVKTQLLGELFQNNVINNFIGNKPSIDIFNDLIGLVFIFIGSALLVKRSRIFIAAILLAPVTSVLYVIILRLPYYFQARELYVIVAGCNFLLVFLIILIEYIVMNGFIKMTNCVENRWHSNEMQIGFMVVMINKGLLIGIRFFFGYNILYIVYSIVMFAAAVFFANRLLKTLEYEPEVNL